MNSYIFKTIISWLSLILLTGAASFTFAQDAEGLDELENLLNELLDEPAPENPAAINTQSAEDVQRNLNGEDPIVEEKSPTEALLDEELWEDHDSAEEILDEDEKWKYAWGAASSISVEDSTNTSAKFKITKVLYDGEETTRYRIYYSEQSLASQKLNLIKDTIVNKVDDPKDSNMVHVELKGLKPETRYYVVISPVHPTDDTIEPLEVITKELNFTTKSTAPVQEPKEEEPSEEPTQEEPKDAEEPVEEVKKDYLTKITNSVKDNSVTLNRDTSETDVDKVNVTLRHTGENKFTEIWSPMYKDGAFTFQVTKIGTYFLKLSALDKEWKILGSEQSKTVKVTNIPDPSQDEKVVVTNPPKVGPTTDLLIGLLIFAMMMYMVMRFRRAK